MSRTLQQPQSSDRPAIAAAVATAAVPPSHTFATLPAAPVIGQRDFITNSNTAVFLAAAAGGGANKVPVVYDGTNWVVG
jgi:hypothetical protein